MASFPVNKKNVAAANVEVAKAANADAEDSKMIANTEVSKEEALSPAAAGDSDTMVITLLLWFFLGGFAAHRWYKKKPAGWNILFILTLGGLGVWWIVDGVNILGDNF